MEEQEILKKIKDPESRNYGFNLLVRKYQQQIYHVIRRMVISHDDTDDLVQEVFIKVWKNLDNFRGDSQLFTWIYRIAYNQCLTFLSRKRKILFIPVHDVSAELNQKIEHDPYIEASEIQLKLQKALLKLPDKQRLIFNMKYFEDLKYQQIAEITGTSIGSLKANYHHAVKKLEELLSAD